jgi:hypothetical protein
MLDTAAQWFGQSSWHVLFGVLTLGALFAAILEAVHMIVGGARSELATSWGGFGVVAFWGGLFSLLDRQTCAVPFLHGFGSILVVVVAHHWVLCGLRPARNTGLVFVWPCTIAAYVFRPIARHWLGETPALWPRLTLPTG